MSRNKLWLWTIWKWKYHDINPSSGWDGDIKIISLRPSVVMIGLMAVPGSMIVPGPPLPSHLININVNFRNVSLPRISHKTKYCTAVVTKFVDSLFYLCIWGPGNIQETPVASSQQTRYIADIVESPVHYRRYGPNITLFQSRLL